MDLATLSFWFSQNAVLSTANRREAFLTNNVVERIFLIEKSLNVRFYAKISIEFGSIVGIIYRLISALYVRVVVLNYPNMIVYLQCPKKACKPVTVIQVKIKFKIISYMEFSI